MAQGFFAGLALCLLLGGRAAAGGSVWTLPPEQLDELCQTSVRRAESALAAVAAVPSTARGFSNTPEALETALQDLEDAAAPAVLLASVGASSATRAAGELCAARLEGFTQAALGREDLALALAEYADGREALSGQRRRLLERELEDWRAAGLRREPRLELRYLRERLANRQQGFVDNLAWPKSVLLFTPEELAGLPEDTLRALPTAGGMRRVEAEPGLYREFMATVRSALPRQRMEFLYRNRAAAANGPVLQEILDLRGRVAEALEAKSYARLVLARTLLPDPVRVHGALEDLARRLRPEAQPELAGLTALLRRDWGPKSRATLKAWDRAFYIERQRLAGSPAPALPTESVFAGVLGAVQKLLHLSIERSRASAWRKDVAFYEVRDAQSGELLGSFYFDAQARPGQAQAGRVFVLSAGRTGLDGSQRPGVCALVASWPGHAGLMEAEQMLHGLGHVLAVLLPRSRYARFSGTGLPGEAAEAAALLLGRLAWRPEIAAAISGGRWGPAVLAQASRSRLAGWPLPALEDTAFALADLDLHGKTGGLGAREVLLVRLMVEGLAPQAEGTHPEASALALVTNGGQASARVLAPVLAQELWQRWLEEGLFNPAAGRHLREALFSSDTTETGQGVRNYLGREPRFDVAPEAVLWPCGAAQDPEPAVSGPPWRARVLR